MSNYFDVFPTVNYNGTYATHIMLRAKFIEASKKMNLTFYPYTIKEGERPDQIAFFYYDDPKFSWLVLLSNNIVDPYFEWPMDNNQFNKYIVKKYGTISESQQKVKRYNVNWYNDDTEITASAYSILDKSLKKYWAPASAFVGNRTYVRKKLDLVSKTNSTITLEVGSASSFVVGERVEYRNGSTVVATAEVTYATGTQMNVQHVAGNWTANPSYVLHGISSGTTTTIESVVDTHNAIPLLEQVYWSPVSVYDWEMEQNESRKNIMLVDSGLKTQVVRELQELMANG